MQEQVAPILREGAQTQRRPEPDPRGSLPSPVFRTHNPALDGTRGIAIALVVLFHFFVYGGLEQSSLKSTYGLLANFGWSGVDLFFVLSGFLITGILIDSKPKAHYFRNFYIRRMLRIFPLYYCFLIFFYIAGPLLLRLAARPQSSIEFLIRPESQIFAWTYALNWLFGFRGLQVPVLIQHFWSLAIEEQFYMGWPLLVRFLPRRTMLAVCAGLIVLSLAGRVWCYQAGLPWAAYAITPCRVDSLAMGSLIAYLIRDPAAFRRLRSLAPVLLTLTGVAIVTIVVRQGTSLFGNRLMDTAGITAVGLFYASFLVCVLGANPAGALGTVVTWAPLRMLGKYSYGIYVFHNPIVLLLRWGGLSGARLAERLGNALAGQIALDVVAFSCTMLIAWLSWNLMEKRFIQLKDRWASK